ncbi:TPA: Lar family restriction alleviation protein [Proteus mirabilis]|nr:Lar family restriction alleviation protein [Proteus mirabilis]
MMSKRIKNCPMCGGDNVKLFYPCPLSGGHYMKCLQCGLKIERASAHETIAAWNRRATKRLNFNLAIDLCKEILAGETALKIKEKYGISERTYKGIKRGKYWTDAMSKAKKMEQES